MASLRERKNEKSEGTKHLMYMNQPARHRGGCLSIEWWHFLQQKEEHQNLKLSKKNGLATCFLKENRKIWIAKALNVSRLSRHIPPEVDPKYTENLY